MIYGVPGDTFHIQLNFSHAGYRVNDTKQTVGFNFTSLGCALGEIITREGMCQSCEGPDLFLMHTPDLTTMLGDFVIEECSPCDKEFFSCLGGNRIEALAGYQHINPNTSTFIGCPL